MKVKRIGIALLLTASIIMSVTACSGSAPQSSGAEANSTNAGASASVSEKPITLRFGTQHPTDSVAHASAEAIKAEVEEKTNGRVNLEIYPSSTLGDLEQMYEELMRGTIDIAHISITDKYDARTNMTLFPFIVDGYDDLIPAFGKDSFAYNKLGEYHEALGVKFLGIYVEGLSGVGAKKEITNPAAINTDKKTKLRVPQSTMFKKSTERLGFQTATVPYSDTFTAIQTGVVDGWVGGPPNLNYLTFRDVIKYYYQYNFSCEATQYVMSMKVYNMLSEDERKIIVDAFAKQAEASFGIVKEEDEKYCDMLREAGIEVITFSKEELAAMAQDVRENVWPSLADIYSQELIDELMADISARKSAK